jgi:hypothetical protein
MSDDAARTRSNRRLTSRTACRLTVRYRARGEWRPATALDLSREGCRLRLGEDLARGSGLTMLFEAPLRDGAQALSVEVPGHVIWCRLEGLSHQAGVRFGNSPDELNDILNSIA